VSYECGGSEKKRGGELSRRPDFFLASSRAPAPLGGVGFRGPRHTAIQREVSVRGQEGRGSIKAESSGGSILRTGSERAIPNENGSMSSTAGLILETAREGQRITRASRETILQSTSRCGGVRETLTAEKSICLRRPAYDSN